MEDLPEKIKELVASLNGGQLAGNSTFYITQYTFWMLVATAILLIMAFQLKKRESLVPHGHFVNGFEYVVEWVRDDIGKGVIGKGYEKHLPFLLTVFLFIVINNVMGLIPGVKPGTGTFSITLAISLIVFIYFNYYGMKKRGVGRYILDLAPKGIGAIAPIVWVLELISLLMRLFTLAIRLFANMYSGHIVMGAFAILTEIAVTTAASFIAALPAVAWVVLLIAMYLLETLVAVIQAYVFTLLTAVYIGLAEGGE